MATKCSKEVLEAVERLGFDYIWTNSQGYPCFVHPDDPNQTEVSINPSINDEFVARIKIRDFRKLAGQLPTIQKRKGQHVKDRLAAERERAERRLQWAEEKKARLLNGQAQAEYIAKIEELIEVRRRQLQAIHHQMTESPASGVHRGRGHVEPVGVAHDRNLL